MTEFKLIAYEKENGEVPVEEFLDSVNPKMRAKIFGLLGILQEKGNMLREPYSKHLDDGIFELRCKSGSDITRVLYFFYYEGKIILTNTKDDEQIYEKQNSICIRFGRYIIKK